MRVEIPIPKEEQVSGCMILFKIHFGQRAPASIDIRTTHWYQQYKNIASHEGLSNFQMFKSHIFYIWSVQKAAYIYTFWYGVGNRQMSNYNINL